MAYKRNVEIFEEAYTKKDDKSTLSYMARDGHRRYIPGSEDPDVEYDIELKTINEESLKGKGDITVAVPVPVVEVTGTAPTQQLAPNTFYKFGSVDSLTLTLGTPTSGVLNIYSYCFTASASFDASTSTYLPDGVVLSGELDIDEGQECEISIRDDKAVFTVWPAPEAPEAPGAGEVDG